MATLPYMQGRKKYGRPQGMLWAGNPGTIVDGYYVPLGNEIGSEEYYAGNGADFIILSDDNREPINFKPTRIEQRQRMVNGRMRAYHIADKLTISTSWSMLPSRSFEGAPEFDSSGNTTYTQTQEYTSDGGAGGVELLDWYDNHQGSFWVYLSYDKYSNFGTDANAFNNLNKYNEIVEVFFSDFSYNIVKRGQYDFWEVSVTLEEV